MIYCTFFRYGQPPKNICMILPVATPVHPKRQAISSDMEGQDKTWHCTGLKEDRTWLTRPVCCTALTTQYCIVLYSSLLYCILL